MEFKICLFILLTLLAATCCAGCVNQSETYSVGYNAGNSPLLTLDPITGEPRGPGATLMNMIAENQNITIKYVVVDDSLEALKKDEVDILSWQLVTEENKKSMDFSDVVIEVTYGFAAKKSSDLTVEDLLSGEKIIACEAGSTTEAWLKDYFGEEKFNQLLQNGKILSKATVDQGMVDVVSSQADAVFHNSIVLSNRLLEQYTLKYVGSVSEPKKFGLAVRAGDRKLMDKINTGYHNLVQSGVIDELSNKYGYFIQKDVYVVGTTDDFAPFAYLDENGNLTGFDAEAMQWIAREKGLNIRFEYMPWSEGVFELDTNKIDAYYSALTITSDRSRKVTFSNPYYTVRNAVAVKDTSRATEEQFEQGDLIVGILDGTTPSDWLLGFYGETKSAKMIEDGKIKIYPNSETRMEALLTGEVEAIISNAPSFSAQMETKPIKILKTYRADELYGVAVRNGDTLLLEKINDGLEEMKAAGVWDELLKKYNL